MDELSIIVLTLAGCVFAVSSVGKLSGRGAYRSFRDELAGTGLIPGSMVPATAAALVGIEASAAAALLAADALTVMAVPGMVWLAESALTGTAALTAVLGLGVAAIVRRGTRARCACFGVRSGRPIGWTHLARNVSLLAVVCAGLVAAPLAPGRPSPPGAVLAALAGAVSALLFARWEDIAGLFAPAPTAARQQAQRES
jgi:Methylamine utilisation protein MauE